uniref:Uncharacterized protein n=2 Tax=Agrobacterium TaxID=357 RepID=A0A2Z2PX45_AGRTU|nr:hypothetical protein [Agrobacterium vitis]ASK47030.1 hypothetical protein [Agrobacterium radiobacter]
MFSTDRRRKRADRLPQIALKFISFSLQYSKTVIFFLAASEDGQTNALMMPKLINCAVKLQMKQKNS